MPASSAESAGFEAASSANSCWLVSVGKFCKRSLAVKRGGDLHRVTDLPEDVGGGLRLDEEMLGLDTALNRLAEVDARLAQVVELRYFAGLSETEIAALLKRSERSVRRDWQKARLYLLASLQG